MQGVELPEGLKAISSMEELIEHTEIFLMVVPTPFVAATMASIKDKLNDNQVCFSFSIPDQQNVAGSFKAALPGPQLQKPSILQRLWLLLRVNQAGCKKGLFCSW